MPDRLSQHCHDAVTESTLKHAPGIGEMRFTAGLSLSSINEKSSDGPLVASSLKAKTQYRCNDSGTKFVSTNEVEMFNMEINEDAPSPICL